MLLVDPSGHMSCNKPCRINYLQEEDLYIESIETVSKTKAIIQHRVVSLKVEA